jgi:DNA invertase Pin-like site-specific DNA recombinase
LNIGYARVSTREQILDLQLDALHKAECAKVFTETAGGALVERVSLQEALSYVRPGDTLVVWRLDRLGRSLKHLVETVAALRERGFGFNSLTEQIDTTTPGGKLVPHVFGALAEFERDFIHERTSAGLAAARARGRVDGRPKALADPKKVELAQVLYADGRHDVATICQILGISGDGPLSVATTPASSERVMRTSLAGWSGRWAAGLPPRATPAPRQKRGDDRREGSKLSAGAG